jgi:hypothetical protein
VAKSRRRPANQPKNESKTKPAAVPGRVGRRPSPPGFLIAIGAAWIICGVIELVALQASWRFVPGIFFIGVGIFFLRGAATTVMRREARRSTD